MTAVTKTTIVLSNPALGPETLVGGDVGADFTARTVPGRAEPLPERDRRPHRPGDAGARRPPSSCSPATRRRAKPGRRGDGEPSRCDAHALGRRGLRLHGLRHHGQPGQPGARRKPDPRRLPSRGSLGLSWAPASGPSVAFRGRALSRRYGGRLQPPRDGPAPRPRPLRLVPGSRRRWRPSPPSRTSSTASTSPTRTSDAGWVRPGRSSSVSGCGSPFIRPRPRERQVLDETVVPRVSRWSRSRRSLLLARAPGTAAPPQVSAAPPPRCASRCSRSGSSPSRLSRSPGTKGTSAPRGWTSSWFPS